MNHLKIIGAVSSVATILLVAPIAFAQEVTAPAPNTGVTSTEEPVVTTTNSANKAEMEARLEEAKKKIELQREEAKAKLETSRENTKKKIEAQREESKKRIETTREEAKAKMEAAREEAKSRMETKREEAKQRLSDIRDKKKQELALKLSDRFDNLNKKWTDHFTQTLDHYNAILLKIQERADIAETNGKDVSAANVAIQSAKTAISTAQTAVTAQAVKTYTLDASVVTTTDTTDTTVGQDELVKRLRTAFQELHKTVFNDLKALRDGEMKNTRSAVQGALQTLSQIPKVDDDNDDNTSNQ